jgi:hypothetical protein
MLKKTKSVKSVLTKTELSKLLKVKTSKEQARTIKRRNVGLLKFLNSLPTTLSEFNKYDGPYEFSSKIGCPHCETFHCDTCSWKAYDNRNEKGFKRVDYKCMDATFGGHNMTEKHGGVTVDYAEDSEYITVYENNNFEVYIVALNRCKTFCQGHIEWANAIINAVSKKK